jgi:hypothetical protein
MSSSDSTVEKCSIDGFPTEILDDIWIIILQRWLDNDRYLTNISNPQPPVYLLSFSANTFWDELFGEEGWQDGAPLGASWASRKQNRSAFDIALRSTTVKYGFTPTAVFLRLEHLVTDKRLLRNVRHLELSLKFQTGNYAAFINIVQYHQMLTRFRPSSSS